MRTVVAGEEARAFIPRPLPPANPPLALDPGITELLEQAEQALSWLDLAGAIVPSVESLSYAFTRKEAVISGRIDGRRASLPDLLTFEAFGRTEAGREADVEEVARLLHAAAHARGELGRAGGAGISAGLLDDTYRHLARQDLGAERPREVRLSVGALLDYIRSQDSLPPLIRAALVQAQFETIRPYPDRNGSIGRLLVPLLLGRWRLLSEPLLYLSLFYHRRQAEYRRRLDAVRTQGDWEGWTSFFLEGVATLALEAVATTRELFARVEEDRNSVLATAASSIMAARLFELLPRNPILTVRRAAEMLQTTKPTATKAIRDLTAAKVLVETTGRKRDRVFSYAGYLELLTS